MYRSRKRGSRSRAGLPGTARSAPQTNRTIPILSWPGCIPVGVRPAWMLVLLAAACGTSGSLVIKKKTTEPSRIGMDSGGEQRWIKVRTEGSDTIIDFHGREFVFKGLTGYEGTLELDEVDLEIGDADVEITTDHVEVSHGDTRVYYEYARLPKGKRVVYSKGSIGAE